MSNTRALTTADYDLKVEGVRVTVHTMGHFFESDTRSGNHASVFLLTSDGNSVRLNMTKDGPTATMGTLKLTHCRYRQSTSSVRSFDLFTRDGLTANDVITLLYARRRHSYKLASSGVGCRFWVATFITDMEDVHYIYPSRSSNATSLRQSLQYNYSRQQSPELEPMIPGTFI